MKSYPKHSGKIPSFDGTEIYYEVRGQGFPVVLLYGIGCLMNHWRHQIAVLSENYQTIVLDYRGHQASEIPKNLELMNLDAIAGDVDAVLKALNIQEAHFVSHSYGGMVLTRYALKNPSAILSATFCNGFLKNPFHQKIPAETIIEIITRAKRLAQSAPTLAQKIWRLTFNNPLTVPVSGLLGGFNLQLTSMRDVEIYSKGLGEMNVEVFSQLFYEMIEADETDNYLALNCPILLIAGEKDHITPLSYQMQMKKLKPQAELTLVPYGSHCTQLDFPELVNLRLEKFFTQ